MPIFDVEIVTRPGEALPLALAQELSDALGVAMGVAPGKVWVRLRALPPEGYAENEVGAERPCPVFVTLTASVPPQGERLAKIVKTVTEAVAHLADRPVRNVHVLVQRPAKGRIAFGGKLVK